MRDSGRNTKRNASAKQGHRQEQRQKPASAHQSGPYDKKGTPPGRSDRTKPFGKPDRSRRNGTPTADAPKRGGSPERRSAATAQPKSAISLSSGRRKGEWWEIKLPEGLAGAPVAVILKQLPVPPKLASKWMAANGAVKQGQHLRLKLFPQESPGFPADWAELNILYEDDFTLVVNKPAGVEVHPSVQGQRGTLAHAVAAYYEASGQACRVRHIHRLDKETTGPVLYAKNEFAHYEFDKAMREKKIERIYLAVAEGVFEQKRGKIDKPIGQDRHHSTRRRVSETGEQAVTLFEVAESFVNHTLVRLRLETGRTHQIRVHLSSIDHPLAGDGMYGGTRRYIHRQALHGEKLVWHHPWTGDRMEVRTPMPADMNKLLQDLREEMNGL
ncbi:RluA family pseudouridine synthase [Paenibacillus hemerocallicola]|uniref:RluA family pseudouridine synthase n=1 Tax=Paenibacillus hemerocallicola TaxID=1172614 RepID=UPI001FE77F16|nr:RluA family pseudouridine synthase [Paenibacillus hemerocallicola]